VKPPLSWQWSGSVSPIFSPSESQAVLQYGIEGTGTRNVRPSMRCAASSHSSQSRQTIFAPANLSLSEMPNDLRSQSVECANRARLYMGGEVANFPPIEAYAEFDRTPGRGVVASVRKPIALRKLSEIVAERREPRWLIHKIIEREVLALIAGPRGTFKSFIALHWAMTAAVEGHSVALLSAEGAGLDRRIDAWMRTYGGDVKLEELDAVAFERQLQLNAPETMAALQDSIGGLAAPPALIVVDTFSKFSAGVDESSNTEVATFLSQIVDGLRDRFAATVLVVAHTGHGDAKRPRGAYALMANPDAEYIVERPSPIAMTVTVSRDRFKDIESIAPLAYTAESIDLGRNDSYGDRVNSLILRETDAPPRATKAVGVNQQRAMAALIEWANAYPNQEILASNDAGALLSRHRIGRQRKPEVMAWLVSTGVLMQCVGGHRVIREAL
jgi:AAA domain